MKNTIAATALIAGLSFAAPALAQEEGSFTGLSVTALAGFDSVKFKAGSDSESKSGFAYAGAVGYDYAFDQKVVVGIEGEIAGSTTKYTLPGIGSLEAGRDLYVGARAGVVVSPNVLLYVKAGYTNAKLKAYAGGFSASDDLGGYRLGAGGEVAYGKAFGRLEYRFSDYGEYDNTGLKITRHHVMAGIGYRF